ncbi:MAG: hypothetical protein Fur0012_07720 [Elusimicrobiota bacterium]
MFKDLRKLGKESLIYGLSTVLARLLNFVLMPFYTHYLLPGQYGIVATVFSYIAFFNIIYGYGLNQGYMRHYKEEGALSSSFNAVFYTSILLSAIVSFFSIPLSKLSGIGAENYRLIIYSAGILCLDAFSLIPMADLRIKHKAGSFVLIRTLSIAVNVALNVLFLAFFHAGIEGIFYANLISSAIAVFCVGGYFSSLKQKMNLLLLRSIFAYSLPFLPAGLSIMIVQVIDRPVMLKLSDAWTVGIYQANYRLAIIMSLLVTMFDQAWRPFVIERASQKDAGILFSKVFKYFTFFAAAVWLFFSLFISDLVSIEIGKVAIVNSLYYAGLPLVPVIMGAYFFNGVYVNFLAPVMISKKTAPVMTATLAGAVVNVALNLAFIPSHGMYAAAWSAFFSYMLMAFLLRSLTWKDYHVSYDYRRFALLLTLSCAFYLSYFFTAKSFSDCSAPAFKTMLFLLFFPACRLTGYFSREEISMAAEWMREKFSRKIIIK